MFVKLTFNKLHSVILSEKLVDKVVDKLVGFKHCTYPEKSVYKQYKSCYLYTIMYAKNIVKTKLLDCIEFVRCLANIEN